MLIHEVLLSNSIIRRSLSRRKVFSNSSWQLADFNLRFHFLPFIFYFFRKKDALIAPFLLRSMQDFHEILLD
jgi:hypothetical protein